MNDKPKDAVPVLTREMAKSLCDTPMVWACLDDKTRAAVKAIASGATKVIPAGGAKPGAGVGTLEPHHFAALERAATMLEAEMRRLAANVDQYGSAFRFPESDAASIREVLAHLRAEPAAPLDLPEFMLVDSGRDLLYRIVRQLVDRIEACGASPHLTHAVCLASDLASAIGNQHNRATVQHFDLLMRTLETPMPEAAPQAPVEPADKDHAPTDTPQYFRFWFDGRPYYTGRRTMSLADIKRLVVVNLVGNVQDEHNNDLNDGHALDITKEPHLFNILPARL